MAQLASGLAASRSLTELHLGYNYLSAEAVVHVAGALLTNRTLRTLDLQANNVTNYGHELHGLRQLCTSLEANATLRHLNLDNNDLRAEGAAMVAQALTTNSTLRELCLESNGLEDEGASAVADVLRRRVHTMSLQVWMRCNHVAQETREAVGQSIDARRGVTLHLEGGHHIADSIGFTVT